MGKIAMAVMLSWLFTLCIYITSYASSVAAANDTLFPNQVLREGETLVSSNQRFELGFFGSRKQFRYLGLWYKNIDSGTTVWVGNRKNPVGQGARLVLGEEGCIFLQDDTGKMVWIYRGKQIVSRPVLQLLDSGNLVLGDSRNVSAGEYLWQSFDHPVDTLLPGMKLGVNRVLTSWRTSDDPAPVEIP